MRTCRKCQRGNPNLQKAACTLHPIPVKPKVWHRVGMDLIDPMPETSRGNKYIITLTDYFSKWAEAAPLTDKTAPLKPMGYWLNVHLFNSKKGHTTVDYLRWHLPTTGDDVRTMALDQHRLRIHLAKCFEKKRLSRFPKEKRSFSWSDLHN